MARWRWNIGVTPHGAAVLVLSGLPLIVALINLFDQWSWLDVAGVVAGYGVGAVGWRVMAGRVQGVSYVPPSNLPPPPTRMVGREDEMEQLKAYLLDVSVRHRVANVYGVAGIGKTAFSLYVAHRVANGFKGGQLFAHFDPDMERWRAVEIARRQFIQALRPPGAAMPDRVEDQAVLYDRLIKKLNRENQLLVVFDDVPTAEVVHQLLPETPWCAVIITSRLPMAEPRGREFHLGPLSEDAALRMLKAIISSERVNQEQGAARDLVRAAACHPLAIQLVGMALANRPHTRLSVARQRMTESHQPMTGTFDNALDLSYAMLTRGEQRALTLLGCLDQRRFAAWELGALLGIVDREAWLLCDRLTDAGLLARRSGDVAGVQFFVLLEHVEGYARRRARALSASESQAAVNGLRDARRSRLRETLTQGVFERVQISMEEGALSRAFKDVRDVIALARELGDRPGEAEATAMLAELHGELGGSGDVRDLLTFPLASSCSLVRIRALRISAKLHRRLRQVDHARAKLAEAKSINRKQRDPVEEIRLLRETAIVESVGFVPAHGLRSITKARALLDDRIGSVEAQRLRAGVAYAEGRVLLAMDLPDRAIDVLRLGAEEAHKHRQTLWQTWIVYQQSKAALQLSEYTDALASSLSALDEFSGMRHRYGGAHCRQLIGQILQAQGDIDGAIRFFGEALETFHNCGDAWVEAEAAEQLANVYMVRGDENTAAALLATARHIYVSIRADEQAARLDRRSSSAASTDRRRLAIPGAGGH